MANPSGLARWIGRWRWGLFVLLFASLCTYDGGVAGAAQVQPRTIYHAFNQRVCDVKQNLNRIRDCGYDAVQLSPLQKSIHGDWWARYQPVDHCQIEGLGSKDDLRQLCEESEKMGICVIADLVFNHMAVVAFRHEWQRAQNDQGFKEELFRRLEERFHPLKRTDFSPWKDMTGDAWDNEHRFEGWGGGEWSDLAPTETVLGRHKEHIDILVKCGVKGFRFDAAKHIRPETIKIYVQHIRKVCPDSYVYLEVLGSDEKLHAPFRGLVPTTDFKRSWRLREAIMSEKVEELPKLEDDVEDVEFVRNHDTILNHDFSRTQGYHTNDPKLSLAWVYMMCQPSGTVLVFPEDEGLHQNGRHWPVQRAVRFRREMFDRKAPPAEMRYVTKEKGEEEGEPVKIERAAKLPDKILDAEELESLAGLAKREGVRSILKVKASQLRDEERRRLNQPKEDPKKKDEKKGKKTNLVGVLRGDQGCALINFGHAWCNAEHVERITKGKLHGKYHEYIYGFDVEFDSDGKVTRWAGHDADSAKFGPQSSLLLVKSRSG